MFLLLIAGICQYGPRYSGCVFQCQCKSEHDWCDESGNCVHGCRDGPPTDLGFTWRGKGCQIGEQNHSTYFCCWRAVSRTILLISAAGEL